MINYNELKVEISKLRNKGGMKAQLAIEYFGIRVTHFRIMVDENGEFWLEMPSIRVFNKYQRCFWILSDEDFPKFRDFVLAKYREHITKVRQGVIEDTTPPGELGDLPDTQ